MLDVNDSCQRDASGVNAESELCQGKPQQAQRKLLGEPRLQQDAGVQRDLDTQQVAEHVSNGRLWQNGAQRSLRPQTDPKRYCSG